MPEPAVTSFPIFGGRRQDSPQKQPFLILASPPQEVVPTTHQLVVGGLDVRLVVGLLPLHHKPRLGHAAKDSATRAFSAGSR